MTSKGFNDDQWRRIYELAEAVLEMPRAARREFLESRATSPEVALEVLDLAEKLETPDDAPSRIGTRIGRFELLEFIGAGGAGEVFSARDPELDRIVAIKILKAEQSNLPDANERFVREARTASTLNHPNIVTVHEIIRNDANLAIVMEFVKGEPLRKFCGSPLPLPRLLHIGQQVAEALAAAHAAGVIHRDIKPENLMLIEGDRAKVLDFGLARLTSGGFQTVQAGVIPGTLRYMSPEHYQGKPVTPRSDVFALGLVLYELATGQYPFSSKPSLDLLHAIATEEPEPPARLNAQLPADLSQIILRMLAKDPAQRPEAGEVAKALGAIRDTPTQTHAPRQSPFKWIVSTAVILLSVLAWTFYPKPAATKAPAKFEQITTLIPENRVTAAAISGDGKYLAYANSDGIFLQVIESAAITLLKTPSDLIVDHLMWLPGGTRLLASGFSEETNQSSVWSVPITGQPPRLLRNDARFATPSPDGKQIAFLANDYSSVWMMEPDGQGDKRVLTAAEGDSFQSVHWAANNRHLIVGRHHNPAPQDGVPRGAVEATDRIESVDSQNGTLVAHQDKFSIWSAAALPTGEVLFVSSEKGRTNGPPRLWSLTMDLDTGAFSSEIAVAPDSPDFDNHRAYALTATADATRLALIRTVIHQPVFVADFNRKALRFSNPQRITLDDSGSYPHAWTGDSKSVIYESDRTKQTYDLFKQHLERRLPEALITTTNHTEVLPQLTSDQKWILFATAPRGTLNYTLARVSLDGGEVQDVPIGGGLLDEFRCSPQPKGRCVLRKSIGLNEFVYFHLDPVKGIGEELARAAWSPPVLGDWDVSPDGRLVAIPNHDTRSAKVRIVQLDPHGPEPKEREITIPTLARIASVVWAADSSGWFITTDTSIGRRMYFYDLNGHVASMGTIQGWAVPSPDGKKVAFLNNIVQGNVWLMTRTK